MTTAHETLLMDAAETARTLGLGRSTFWRLHSAGKVPLPVRLGRRTLWRRDEIEAWVRAGCPPRSKWEATKRDWK